MAGSDNPDAGHGGADIRFRGDALRILWNQPLYRLSADGFDGFGRLPDRFREAYKGRVYGQPGHHSVLADYRSDYTVQGFSQHG